MMDDSSSTPPPPPPPSKDSPSKLPPHLTQEDDKGDVFPDESTGEKALSSPAAALDVTAVNREMTKQLPQEAPNDGIQLPPHDQESDYPTNPPLLMGHDEGRPIEEGVPACEKSGSELRAAHPGNNVSFAAEAAGDVTNDMGGGGEGGGGVERQWSGSMNMTGIFQRRSSQTSSCGECSNVDSTGVASTVGSAGLKKLKMKMKHSIGSNKSDAVDGESVAPSEFKKSMWTKLAKKTDIWEDDEDDEDTKFALKYAFHNAYNSLCRTWNNTMGTLRKHPYILVVFLLTLGLLTTFGVLIVVTFSNQHEDALKDEALDLAAETGGFFSDQLDRAILPLFSMVQFVNQLDIFRDLAKDVQKTPHLPPKTEGGAVTHRNVTGVCDRPELVERFNDIAATIKKNAGMQGVLVNIQLAPAAVVCLLHPLNNTEDFPPGVYMDNTGAWGHDLLHDPKRKFIAAATVPSKDVVIAGPLPLRQCKDCDPTVEKAFIARLPIEMEGNIIEIDGVSYDSWGFAVVLINWKELVDRSDIFDRFDAKGYRFKLTRTDRNVDSATGEYVEKTVVLAESDDGNLTESSSVTADLETTNNLWQMTVSRNDGFRADWEGWGIAAAVIIAFTISVMLLVILIEKQTHENLLREMLPPRALRKIKRGETVVEKYNIATTFFSDIVGYTSMSADMRPIEVMRMLNEFYNEMDKVCEKHGVFKIETIGDAYMCCGGVPDRCMGPAAAEKVALFALESIELVESYRTRDGGKLLIRAGINSGPVVAGVVGTKRPQYTVFGDSVNLAARMESTSQTMKIQCSDMTYRLLRDAPNYCFDLEERGGIEVKGKGRMHTWWINGATKGRLPPLTSERMINKDWLIGGPTKGRLPPIKSERAIKGPENCGGGSATMTQGTASTSSSNYQDVPNHVEGADDVALSMSPEIRDVHRTVEVDGGRQESSSESSTDEAESVSSMGPMLP